LYVAKVGELRVAWSRELPAEPSSVTVIQSPTGKYYASFVVALEDRFFPSTQLCSACGVLTGPKGLEGLSVRSWACGCGAIHDRDGNAEITIRREGKRLVAAGRRTR
jgi:hypothetical protein